MCKDNCYFYCGNVQRQLLFLLSECAKTAAVLLLKCPKIAAIVPIQKCRNSSCFYLLCLLIDPNWWIEVGLNFFFPYFDSDLIKAKLGAIIFNFCPCNLESFQTVSLVAKKWWLRLHVEMVLYGREIRNHHLSNLGLIPLPHWDWLFAAAFPHLLSEMTEASFICSFFSIWFLSQ